ncbi:hypothetical protein [Amycolatopsis albispora]|uniref:Uncharacterized protein n=1 Tax=Amycolatopsis albispora TaxID=1804986 RepID=A0A344L5P6_9PSEU|nr:hypothetical protein [Amycolatopsis albispora]AXB43370.1 hypothetical protein A4R43_13095 [Amycolatopsis albispora]
MSSRIPAVARHLCDDAAVFPPGLAPLPDAVRAYLGRAGAWYEDLVGPLVLAAKALPELGSLLPDDGTRLPLSVTLPDGPAGLPGVLDAVAALPVELRSIEVAVPAGLAVTDFLAQLDDAPEVDVYVEVPRDDRRPRVLDGIAGRYRAKFRTGGVRADLYPDEAELAAAIAAVVAAGVPFKATAGLHHAVRNTDPETGFEQHGFLNLLVATDGLLDGGSTEDAAAVLAERDGAKLAGTLAALGEERAAAVRASFTSFGTCSITDPLTELVELGLVTAPRSGAGTEGTTA